MFPWYIFLGSQLFIVLKQFHVHIIKQFKYSDFPTLSGHLLIIQFHPHNFVHFLWFFDNTLQKEFRIFYHFFLSLHIYVSPIAPSRFHKSSLIRLMILLLLSMHLILLLQFYCLHPLKQPLITLCVSSILVQLPSLSLIFVHQGAYSIPSISILLLQIKTIILLMILALSLNRRFQISLSIQAHHSSQLMYQFNFEASFCLLPIPTQVIWFPFCAIL